MAKQNPFYHRTPIQNINYFCNRQAETKEILSLLANGQSVSIVGPRRIGKTSLLFHLKTPEVLATYNLSPDQYCLIYVDCAQWGHLQPHEIFTQLAAEIDQALRRGSPEAVSSDTMTFSAFRQTIKRIINQGVKLVFLLDEFDGLSKNAHLSNEFFSALRSLSMHFGVVYITSSVKSLADLAQANDLTSPFFNFFYQIRLGLFSFSEAKALLKRLVALEEADFTTPVVDALLEMAGPHPFLLQIAGYYAFQLKEEREIRLNDADLAQVGNQFNLQAEPHWHYYWHRLSEHQQKQLALLSESLQPDVETGQRLTEACLVVQQEGKLRYLSPCFGHFVSRQPVRGLVQILPLILDLDQQMVLFDGRPLQLTGLPFDLLVYLVQHPNQSFSLSQLEREVWPGGYEHDKSKERVKKAIQKIRRVLNDEEGNLIVNVRGKGYKFAVPV